MRKPDLCIFENKCVEQLRGDSATDQRLCFRYIVSIIPLLPVSENFMALAIFCGYTARFV